MEKHDGQVMQGEKRCIESGKGSRWITLLLPWVTAAVIVSGAISVPILCRLFYHAHITPLQMRLRCGLDEDQIKMTYDEVMDYCLGLSDNFVLTHMRWSAKGAAHFADVRALFIFNMAVLAISAILLGLICLHDYRCRTTKRLLRNHIPAFWAASGLLVVLLTAGVLGVIDFDRFFTAFHKVFFPGKDNWIFDPSVDPVIRMLPEVFFRNCALLVFGLIIGSCILLLLFDRKCRKQN